jgi:microsomal epoxide hydrolase/non-specific protein-tyrosine kinase
MTRTVSGSIPAYEELGSGPTVVLLSDRTPDKRPWRDEARAIAAAGYRVVVPALQLDDVCQRDRADDAPVRQADAVAALLGYLGIGRAAFVGRDQFGEVLRQLCVRHPRRVVAAGVLAAGPDRRSADSRARLISTRSSDFKKILLDFLLGLSRSLHAQPVLRALA